MLITFIRKVLSVAETDGVSVYKTENLQFPLNSKKSEKISSLLDKYEIYVKTMNKTQDVVDSLILISFEYYNDISSFVSKHYL